jgi:hypothetical protein
MAISPVNIYHLLKCFDFSLVLLLFCCVFSVVDSVGRVWHGCCFAVAEVTFHIFHHKLHSICNSLYACVYHSARRGQLSQHFYNIFYMKCCPVNISVVHRRATRLSCIGKESVILYCQKNAKFRRHTIIFEKVNSP